MAPSELDCYVLPLQELNTQYPKRFPLPSVHKKVEIWDAIWATWGWDNLNKRKGRVKSLS